VWNNHVDLGLWADLMLIAPATANTMSKMTNGTVDNLLLAVYLSAKCPVYFAPAMDLDMYKHPSTTQSIEKLTSYGNQLIPAASGELASGLVGEGRMAEPEEIIRFIEADMEGKLPLKGKKVLITAGPTYEAIDPVRFIGNHSSGKMGFELARKAANHIAIAAAAVADYTPLRTSDTKIKKQEGNLPIELKATKDILAAMGTHKEQQFLVGFALETNNEIEHAKGKLARKNLDMIVLNSLRDKGAGFAGDTNKITIIDKGNTISEYPLQSKEAVASNIFSEILKRYHE